MKTSNFLQPLIVFFLISFLGVRWVSAQDSTPTNSAATGSVAPSEEGNPANSAPDNSPSVPSEASLEELFRAGIDAFNKKQWEKAHAAFEELVRREPRAAVALYNLGLTDLQMGKKGAALARFRMALFADGGLEAAQVALRELAPKVDRPFQAREASVYELLRSAILLPTSFTFFVVLTAILIGLTGFSFLRYVKLRRQADADSASPPGPPIPALIFATLTFVALGTFAAKITDRASARVTVVRSKTPLLAGPAENTLSLLEIPEGNELIVKSSHADKDGTWLQVTLPGSSSGWISANSAMLSAGEATW